MTQILITGGAGFIGKNLSSHLSRSGFDVLSPEIDVTEPQQLKDFFNTHQPEIVVHLAAISHVHTCEKNPKQAVEVNVGGTIHLARTLVECSPKTVLIFPSTAQIYRVDSADPSFAGEQGISEESPILPQNFYAQTKWLAEKALEHFRDHQGLPTVILRLFNHSHFTQTEQAFLPSMYQQLLRAKTQSNSQIAVGNLDLWRDIGSLQDLLHAFTQVARNIESNKLLSGHTFNLCSGTTKNLKSLTGLLADRLQVSTQIKVDPARLRKNDPLSVRGNPAKFSENFDWTPTSCSEAALIDAFLEPMVP
jgi:GDP-4-dehydro-6-deoxy-D-mannose reductase